MRLIKWRFTSQNISTCPINFCLLQIVEICSEPDSEPPCQTSRMKFFANKRSAWIRLLLLPRNIWNQSFSQRPLTRKLSGIRFCSTMIVMQMWPELICVCFIWKKKVEMTITTSVQISRSCVATGTLFKRILNYAR